MNEEPDLDVLLDQLKNGNSTLAPQVSAEPNINNETVNDYILSQTKVLIDGGVDSVEALKQAMLTSGQAEEITAYSEMFKAVVGALDTLTKIEINNKKIKANRELQEYVIAAKKQLPQRQGNTNILVATREEIIKHFLEKGKEVIDATAAFEPKSKETENEKPK